MFLVKYRIVQVQHSPNSPDLQLYATFSLFINQKFIAKVRFDGRADTQKHSFTSHQKKVLTNGKSNRISVMIVKETYEKKSNVPFILVLVNTASGSILYEDIS